MMRFFSLIKYLLHIVSFILAIFTLININYLSYMLIVAIPVNIILCLEEYFNKDKDIFKLSLYVFISLAFVAILVTLR